MLVQSPHDVLVKASATLFTLHEDNFDAIVMRFPALVTYLFFMYCCAAKSINPKMNSSNVSSDEGWQYMETAGSSGQIWPGLYMLPGGVARQQHTDKHATQGVGRRRQQCRQ